ncbi:MAG: hypothetical protein RSB10_02450 [Clostridia bacterium]
MNRLLERDKVKFANQHAPVNQNFDGQNASMSDNFAYEQSMRDRNFDNAQVANQQMPNTESAYNNAYPNTNYNYQQSLQNARNACASSNQNDCYQRQPQQAQPQMQQGFAPQMQQMPQMQQNATPYANGYRANQNLQRDNYSRQDNGYYAQQNNAFDNINYQQNQQPKFEMATTAAPTKVGQKKGLNTKVKLLIGVYFFIVTVIVALLLVNALTVDKPVSASQDELMSYKQEVVNYAVGDDGSVQELKQANTIGDYTFDENTNWFDKMCDKIGAIFG